MRGLTQNEVCIVSGGDTVGAIEDTAAGIASAAGAAAATGNEAAAAAGFALAAGLYVGCCIDHVLGL
jgi:hypothetical protein